MWYYNITMKGNMKYTNKQIEAGIKFLNNKNVMFDIEIDDDIQRYADGTSEQENMHRVRFDIDVEDRIWTSGDGWASAEQDKNNEGKTAVKGVKVTGLSLNAYKDYNETDAYWSGGMNGNAFYDGSGKDGTWNDGISESYEDKNKRGVYLINDFKLTGDGQIYGDTEFTRNLDKYLEDKCDFDSKLLSEFLEFSYSEQGAQEDGYVNFDTDIDGDFWKLVDKKREKNAI
jgi:hypothetical protein